VTKLTTTNGNLKFPLTTMREIKLLHMLRHKYVLDLKEVISTKSNVLCLNCDLHIFNQLQPLSTWCLNTCFMT
jgi:GTP:adenosylcobinamide-phosphate guanylyltransferase